MNGNVYTLITGASEGLGKALAIECASRGYQLILVALAGSGLSALANYIRDRFEVAVIAYEDDLSEEAACRRLYTSVSSRGYRVNMLINNAGIGNTNRFDESSFEFYKRQLDLNITSVVLLTHLFVPMMKNHPSYILNVGSLCTFFYLPEKQVYGGTKSFIYFFSRSLRRELRPQKISVSVLCPGGMNTNLRQYLSSRSLSPIARLSMVDPADVAFIAIRDLLRGKEAIIPGRLNRLFLLLDKLVSTGLKDLLIARQVRTMGKMPAC